MKAAIYSRKSKFTGKGESIENQIHMCKNYILNHLKNITESDIDIYEDEGFSGKNTDRPKLQLLLKKIQQGAYQYVVCYRLDRISRNINDFSHLIENLNQKNVGFICIKEQFDTTTPMGRAMMYIASVFSQLERETIAERIRDNMLLLAKTGRWLGGSVPLGLQSTKEILSTADGKPKTIYRLTLDESTAPLVCFIYEKYSLIHSITALERCLYEKGYLTKNNRPFSRSAIKSILQNPVYCKADKIAYDFFIKNHSIIAGDKNDFNGEYAIMSYNKRQYPSQNINYQNRSRWIIAVGAHKGLIDGAQWVKIQNEIDKKNNICSSHAYCHNKTALLSGVLYCKNCHSPMYPKTRKRYDAKGQQYFSYVCRNKAKLGNTACDICNLDGIGADQSICHKLFCALEEYFDGILFDTHYLKTIDTVPCNNKLYQQLKEKKQAANQLIETLKLTKNKNIFIHYIEPALLALDTEIKELEQKIDALSNEEKQYKSIQHIDFNALTVTEKKYILKHIIKKAVWDGKQLDLYLKSHD